MFSGYAPVHFLCFLPVYQELRNDPNIDIFLSGGFRDKSTDPVSYRLEGFYDPFPVDKTHILPVDDVRQQDFDVVVCAHLSDALFPRSTKKTVQTFHGVSFKNLAVRQKALRFDYLCMPGRYHVDMFRKHGLLTDERVQILLTGFSKSDGMVAEPFDKNKVLADVGIDHPGPTVLFAPTGDKRNALELRGEEIVQSIIDTGEWNLLIKPHDHPKNPIDWFEKLARYESDRVRLVRGRDVVPYLRAADLLLTDASSVAVEYTLLDRPIVFVDVPKLLKKMEERAPALDLETYGRKIGTIVTKNESVTDAIRDALKHPDREGPLRRKMASHVFFEPGHAAKRVADVVRHAAGLTEQLPNNIEVIAHDPATAQETR